MELINTKTNNLFTKWQKEKSYATFFNDGLLDEQAWLEAPIRVLFLLKESYSWRGLDGPVNMQNGINSKFWWNICRWKHLIYRSAEGVDASRYPLNPELEEVRLHGYLLRDIAYVNIKKPLGKSRSNAKEILKYAVEDRDYLNEELNILQPDVVFCGGNFWAYHVLCEKGSIERISDRVWKHGNRLVFDYYHPGYYAAKGGQVGLYERLHSVVDHPEVRRELQVLREKRRDRSSGP